MSKLHRTEVGPHFSEWSRLVWGELQKRGHDQAWLAKELGVGSGTVCRWLYGDRKPGIAGLLGVQRLLGVAPDTVQHPPSRKFKLPGATGKAA